MNDFEKDDEVIAKSNEVLKKAKADSKTSGIDMEIRFGIKDIKNEKITHLEGNISMQRDEQGSRVIGMLEDVNEVIKDPKNKIYLR